jgi:hypothetical protein
VGNLKTVLVLVAVLAAGCTRNRAVTHAAPSTQQQAGEAMRAAAGGWRILDLSSFRGWDADAVPSGWSVVDGTIAKTRGAEDLITKDQFANFELELEWKIGQHGNSGIFYRGTRDYDHIYWSAPEYQLEDNIGADDNKSPDRWTAADYALYAPSSGQIPTADKWNLTRIVVNGRHVEHWLNGAKVVEYELGSPDWKARVAKSKFAAYPKYGMAQRGYIGIQGDHPGALALRNIRIRELP